MKFLRSTAKRIIVKAGRRGGKTVGAAIRSVEAFLSGLRVLYAAPTGEQTEAYWYEVVRALQPAIDAGVYGYNRTERYIERPGTKNRIKAKTAWNADTLRGDYADLLVLEEFQLMCEDTWEIVGAPMLADNNGTALFIFTPPSLQGGGGSRARDPRHASKLHRHAQADTTGLWEAFHFTSFDNPYISRIGLELVASSMSLDSYRRELLAIDDDVETSWLVYNKFNEALCKVTRFQIPSNWPVCTGHDFGIANPAALFLAEAQLPLPVGAPAHMRRGDMVVFREYCPGAGYSITDHVVAFKDITQGYRVSRSVGGAHSEDEIRQGYSAHGWPIAEPGINRVNVQVDRVIGLMEQNKLFIIGDMVGLLAQVSNCMWELDNENKATNRIANEARYHLLAALRYIGSSFIPSTLMGDQRTRVSQKC